MKQTRWAMVGTGLMLRLIGRDLRLTENVEARVIVSRRRETADAAAAEYGFAEASDDFEAVLRRDDIDVVYIATPHSEHFRLGMAALAAGKHILVEKPMTISSQQTRDLCEFARRQGLFAMEAMWTAFNPAIIEMRRRVAGGAIGNVRLMHANFGLSIPYDAKARIWAKELAGGSTLDQGVYTLSLAHMLFGTPTTIVATGSVLERVDAEAVVTLGFPGGERAVCVNGLRAATPMTAYIAGDRGHIALPQPFWAPAAFQQVPCDPTQGEVDQFSFAMEGSGYVPMLRGVSAAVLDGQTQHPLRTHAESIAVAETMDEVLRQILGQSAT